MAQNSKIEWTDATWNPILGCDKISPGCKNCYAIRTAHRLQSNPNPKVAKAFEGLTVIQGGQPNWTGRVNFVEERLNEPLRWGKPKRIFVNSQSDLFHDGVSEDTLQKIFKVMCQAKQHVFQVLTKRPARMLAFLSRWDSMTRDFGPLWPNTWPQRHIWLGVSCENQQTADERIPLLLQTPVAVRWVSAEPLLGPIKFRFWHCACGWNGKEGDLSPVCPGSNCPKCGLSEGLLWTSWLTGIEANRMNWKPGSADLGRVDWVVVGGESGPYARPMDPDWARSIRDQCLTAGDFGVPFFFKQWGEYLPVHPNTVDRGQIIRAHGTQFECVGKKAAGRLLDGKEWNQYPEVRA